MKELANGGRGYVLQKFDWDRKKWMFAGNICDKCLKVR